ncbi:MAG TPA: TolC family protein [Thermoanaerobaculia bacterium]|jgi:outer membrane protein TolC|nr:TolC family protein [Thermoanaerobaculia bacterium]
MAPVTLTLNDALKRALSANPALGRARAQIGIAQAQAHLAISSILPRISLSGALVRNSLEAGFGSGKDRTIILAQNDWNYRVNLAQPIYAGNRERRALEQSRLAVTTAQESSRGAEENLLIAVVADFLGIAQGDALIAVEKQNIGLAGERHEQAQNLFEAGESTKVDVLRAEADTKAAQRRLAEAQRQRDQSESRLRVDLALDQPIRVGPPGAVFPRLPPEAALLAEAERQRPEVAEANLALESARLEVRKQRGGSLPVVTANGAYISQRSPFPADRYGQFSLNVNVPIFDSGEVKARVAVARQQELQAELRLAEVRQGVREDVRRARVDLAAAEASLVLARDQLTASEAEHAQASDLYRAQETTALDLAAAEASLADARRAVATGQLDRDLAELRVWAAAGLLKKTVFEEGAQ